MKEFNTIGSMILLHINVILNDNEIIYDGVTEDAPAEIKNLRYYDVKMGNPIKLFVHTE